MSNPIYKGLPPVERKPDNSLYRMTPARWKRASAFIRWECCRYDNGNCLEQDDGDAHTCTQSTSCAVCCKWFRWAVLPQDMLLEAEIFHDSGRKLCAVCGSPFVSKSNRAKYCPDCATRVHRRQKAKCERKKFQELVRDIKKGLIAELDGRKLELVKRIAELTVEAISLEQLQQISGYLDDWDSVTFDDKRRVVDLMITTIAATSDKLNITWKI